MKFVTWFFLVVAVMMVIQWGFFLAIGAVPELETEPYRIGFHLAAEFATAVSLFTGGLGLLRGKSWGRPFGLFAAGMLAYTSIVSPGYFAQLGQWQLVLMFAVLLALDGISVAALMKPKS